VVPDADLVVSGCNKGANLGAYVLGRSGTVSAAVEAAFFDVPAIAVSLYVDPGDRAFAEVQTDAEDYDAPARATRYLAEHAVDAGVFEHADYLNLNAPEPAEGHDPEMAITRPSEVYDMDASHEDPAVPVRMAVVLRLGSGVEPLTIRGERTDGEGFDVVFDATGHESGLRSAATAVRKGGQVVLVGQSGDISMDFTPFIRGEVDVQCSYASTWKDFEYGLRLLSEGAVEVEPLLDDRFAPSDEGDIFRAAKAGETCKPLLEFAGGE
jgi:hypothetical protein